MNAILKQLATSIFCIPCVWSLLGALGVFGTVSFFLNSWVPYRGPLPSDGPVEGFASKTARIDYYDTGPLRIRTAVKFGVIGGIFWLVGLVTSLVILKSLGA